MASITITIPDADVAAVLDSFSTQFNYAGNKLVGETKAQFAKRMTAEWIKDLHISQTMIAASVAAGDVARSQALQVVIT